MTVEELLLKITGDPSGAQAAIGAVSGDLNTKLTTAAQAAGQQVGVAGEQVGVLGGALEAIAPQLIAAFSIGAITEFVSHAIEAGSHIDDLSLKLDVSRDAVQRWGYAASLSGATMEDVSTAVAFMNKTLGGGSDSTVAALRQAGLSFSAVRDLRPEDAFNAIVDAIQKIPDPMTQARVTMELFGRGGAVLLPAIRDGFKDVGDQASVMSDETIANLDRAGDAWTTLQNRIGAAAGAMVSSLEQASDTVRTLAQLLAEQAGVSDHTTKKAGELANQFSLSSAAADLFIGPISGVIDALAHLRDDLPPTKEEIKKQEQAMAGATAAALAHATALTTQHVPALAGSKESVDKAKAAMELMNLTYGDSEQKTREAAKAQDEHTKKIQALADTIVGRDIAQKATDLAEALKLQGGASKLTATQTDDLFKKIDALVKGPLGSSALPKSLKDVWIENVHLTDGLNNDVTPALQAFLDHLDGVDRKLPILKDGIKTFMADTKTPVVQGWKDMQKAGEDAWKADQKAAEDSLKAQKEAHDHLVSTITMDATDLINSLKGGWKGLQNEAERILGDILTYFEDKFIKKLVEKWIDGFTQIGSYNDSTGIPGLLGQFNKIQIGGTTSASATSSAWITAMSSIMTFASEAFAPYMIGHLLNPGPMISPVPNFPTTPPPNGPENGGPSEPGSETFASLLAWAQNLWDLNQNSGGSYASPFFDFMAQHPELWGHGTGFREGTFGRFLPFGAGFPTTLHGDEAVVPRGEGPTLAQEIADALAGLARTRNTISALGALSQRASPSAGENSGAGTTVIINATVDARGSMFQDRGAMNDLADIVADRLAARYRQRYATGTA